MAAISIMFVNSNDESIRVQVDSWAGVYLLKKGQSIEIIGQYSNHVPNFTIHEVNDSRILDLSCCSEYYVVWEGKRMHWTEFLTNIAHEGEHE